MTVSAVQKLFCDVIANDRTPRPSVPTFGKKVPHLRRESPTNFKVKRSKVGVTRPINADHNPTFSPSLALIKISRRCVSGSRVILWCNPQGQALVSRRLEARPGVGLNAPWGQARRWPQGASRPGQTLASRDLEARQALASRPGVCLKAPRGQTGVGLEAPWGQAGVGLKAPWGQRLWSWPRKLHWQFSASPSNTRKTLKL